MFLKKTSLSFFSFVCVNFFCINLTIKLNKIIIVDHRAPKRDDILCILYLGWALLKFNCYDFLNSHKNSKWMLCIVYSTQCPTYTVIIKVIECQIRGTIVHVHAMQWFLSDLYCNYVKMLQTAYWLKWPKCKYPRICGPEVFILAGPLSKA